MSTLAWQRPHPEEVGNLLRTAVQYHQSGRLGEAAPIYRQVLDLVPDHPDALHLAGVLAFQGGRALEALELIDKALARSATFAEAHSNRGNVLRALGRTDDAVAAYRQAITLAPANPLPWGNLGNALRDSGRTPEALLAYQEAIRRQPGFAEAHLNQGIVLRELGRGSEALASFEAAIRARPEFAAAHDQYGNALRDAGRLDEAIAAYERAVSLDPGFTTGYCNLGSALWEAGRYHAAADALQAALALDPRCPDAHNHMGNVCKSLGYLDQAQSAYREALVARPDYAEAHFNLGVLLGELEKPVEALASYRAALSFKADFADAFSNLGATLMKLERPGEAITAYRRALELKPDFSGAWYNLGNALQEEGRTREAVAAFDRARELQPGYAQAEWNRGLALLAAGDYEEGWKGYEWRWQVGDIGLQPRAIEAPRWDGAPLNGRTILVHCEQGLGDTLQFVRYLPMVAERGGRVVLECQPSLKRLLEAIPSVAFAVAQGAPLPPFDCHIPLLSLPGLFGTRLATVPAEVPYLPAQAWSAKIPVLPPGEGVRVGLVWSGSHKPNPRRSIPLDQLSPLFSITGVTWYSLQVGEHAAQLAQHPLAARMIDLSPLIHNFADTAALAGQLDLIISIDTSVAHLAGGLGLDCWVLLSAAADWRWFGQSGESVWYPTARLFRQPRPGDWASVIEQVGQELRAALFCERGAA